MRTISAAGIVSIPAACRMGSAFPDGCPGAPTGATQFPTLLNVYGASRPPWNVPGVDYYAGVPSSIVLRDPLANVAALTALGFSVNTTTRLITANSNGLTLDGYDMTGWTFEQPAGVSGSIVQNCKFKITVTPLSNVPIYVPSGGSLTVQFCELDGSATDDSSTFGCLITYNGGTVGGTLTVQWCYMHDVWQHSIDYGGQSITAIIRYNILQNNGVGTGGVHPDPWFNNGGGLLNSQHNFNLIYDQGASFAAGTGNPAVNIVSDNSLSNGQGWSNSDCSNNTVVGSAPTAITYCLWFAKGIDPVTNCTMNRNYCDGGGVNGIGSFGFWNSPSSPGVGCSTLNNVNMVTGLVVPSPWSN